MPSWRIRSQNDCPSNTQALKSRIEESLFVGLKWFTQNRLKINPAKTEMVILKSRRQNINTDLSVQFGNDKISPASSVKVLGVTIDSQLTWENHIAFVVRKCYCVLIGLARIRHRLPRCIRQLLVEALVFPHIRYCMSVWGNCTATQKRRVQKAINFGARLVFGLGRRDHVTPALRELKWSDVDELLIEHDIANMNHLMSSEHASELLRERVLRRSDVSTRSTRATEGGQLQLPRVRTEFARGGFLYRAAATWNSRR